MIWRSRMAVIPKEDSSLGYMVYFCGVLILEHSVGRMGLFLTWVGMPVSGKLELNTRYVTITPSQPKEPLILLFNPELPFQQTVINVFNLHNRLLYMQICTLVKLK